MVAPTFANLGLETEGTTGDPMEPESWSSTSTATALEIAEWGTGEPPGPAEDFESGWCTANPAILVSAEEPFALVDGSNLFLVQEGGANPEQVRFVTGDFPDIANASAAEVLVVMQAQLTGNYQVETALGRVLVKSSPFGSCVEVDGLSRANDVLGFPTIYDAFVGEGLDTDPAEWVDSPEETAETFDVRWAGLAAQQYAEKLEPYALTDTNTLLVAIDGGAPQVVTFSSGDFVDIANATAAEVAAVFTAQLTGAVGVYDNAGRVSIRSSFLGVGSSVVVTGGTDLGAFISYYPSIGSVIYGNETDSEILPSATSALWDEGGSYESDTEDFEALWLSNESYAWILTKDQIVILGTPATGTVYTVTINGESFTYTSTAGQTAANVASALASDIDANSSYMSAVDASGVITLTRLNNRTEISLSVSAVSSSSVDITSTSIIVSTADFDASTGEQALWDSGSPEAVEDFEEEWLSNESFVWVHTDDEIAVSSAFQSGVDYTVTITLPSTEAGPALISATANDATANALATTLAGLIDASPYVSASATGPVITVTRADGRTELQYAVSDSDVLLVGASDMLGGGLEAAVFRNVGDFETTFDFETFEVEPGDGPLSGVNVVYQHSVEVTDNTDGRYSIFVQGQEFFYEASGDGVSTIASELRNAITVGGDPFGVEAVLQGLSQNVRIRSTNVPVTPSGDIGIAVESPNNGLVATAPEVFEEDNWTWGAFLRTLP